MMTMKWAISLIYILLFFQSHDLWANDSGIPHSQSRATVKKEKTGNAFFTKKFLEEITQYEEKNYVSQNYKRSLQRRAEKNFYYIKKAIADGDRKQLFSEKNDGVDGGFVLAKLDAIEFEVLINRWQDKGDKGTTPKPQRKE